MTVLLTFVLNGALIYCSMLAVERLENTSLMHDDSGQGLLSGLLGTPDDRTPGPTFAKTAALGAMLTTLTGIPVVCYAWSLKRKLQERMIADADA